MILTKLEDLSNLRSSNPDSSIVMVNGAFDLFHNSHLDLLELAKSRGDILVVCITSDESIKAGKGIDRPIIPQRDRAKIVDGIKYVDYTFVNNTNQSSNINDWPGNHLRPNLIISGDARWYHNDPRVKDLGIKTELLDRGQTSTTDIIKRVRDA